MRMSARVGALTPPPAAGNTYYVSCYDVSDPDNIPLAVFEAAEYSTVHVDLTELIGFQWILDDQDAVTSDDQDFISVPYTQYGQSECEFTMPSFNVAVWMKMMY